MIQRILQARYSSDMWDGIGKPDLYDVSLMLPSTDIDEFMALMVKTDWFAKLKRRLKKEPVTCEEGWKLMCFKSSVAAGSEPKRTPWAIKKGPLGTPKFFP